MPTANRIVLEKTKELARVLRASQMAGYASGQANDNGDGTKFTEYREGCWLVVDEWGGGRPSRDVTDVYYEGILCWSITGRDVLYVDAEPGSEEYLDQKDIIVAFLRDALVASDGRYPLRGPSCFGTGNLRYYCESVHRESSDIGEMFIREKIVDLEGNMLYAGTWIGGWTNLY